MSLPIIAAVALAGTMLGPKTPRQVVKESLSKQLPGGHPLERPTAPSGIWVDTAMNTALRDDRPVNRGPVTITDIDQDIRETYMREAASHPGVRLMAGKAVV